MVAKYASVGHRQVPKWIVMSVLKGSVLLCPKVTDGSVCESIATSRTENKQMPTLKFAGPKEAKQHT